MDKYLLEILKEVNTIIIPGLGALTITNNKTGEVMFMPYLKHDDGNLAKFIAEKEGIDLNDAKNIIAKYVREIESKLNVGDTYDMFRFGSFSKNADGDVEFNSWHGDIQTVSDTKHEEQVTTMTEEISVVQVPAENFITQEETTQEKFPEKKDKPVDTEVTVSAQPLHPQDQITANLPNNKEDSEPEKIVDEALESPTVIEVNITDESTVVHTTAPAINEPKHNSKEKEIAETNTDPATIGSTSEEMAANAFSKKDSPNKEVTKVKTVEAREEKKPPITVPSESRTKKKGPFFYAMVAGIVLVIGGALTIALFYNSLEPYLPFVGKTEADTTVVENKKEEPVGEETDEENVANESSSTPTENTTMMDEQTPSTNQGNYENTTPSSNRPSISGNGTGKYYLIVGSFKVKGNAERYSSDITESSVVECNNAYYVVLGSYETAAEAKTHLKDVAGNFNPWVFQIPC